MKLFNRAIQLNGEERVINGVVVDIKEFSREGHIRACKLPVASLASVQSQPGFAVGCRISTADTGVTYWNTGTTTSSSFTTGVPVASGKVLVGNSSGLGTAVDLSGVLSVTNSGVTSFAAGQVVTDTVTVTAANIVSGTTMKALVAAPASGKYIRLISASIAYTYATAAYTGGGNVSLALGTTIITGIISAANSFGKGSNAVIQFVPLSTAGIDLSAVTATALNINVAAGAFTQPGTAAGTAKVYVTYVIESL